MSEIFFYHLVQSPLEQTLPELLGKCLSRDWRVIVRGTDTKRMVWLDEILWGGTPDSFLPHGFMTGANDARQPVLLTEADKNVNNAQVLMLVDGATATADEINGYERTCLLFDGNNPDALNAARSEWKRLTDAGVVAKYWSQADGPWALKASSGAS
ncbi:DNA polymerase III subunit chi [Amylibacter kogurei]|uniref:DNA polymerase III subunit chi n=1 Tax=Paramylibacter kogurei TaxID=1889778 RepID=A0A2G5K5S4_9RHOB|nr:DNA polymerase III subunit chi [Amylibacter kogurei]PIB24896.1 DNA polymerase III subunit chi [Amylibacter kogurei]